MDDETIVSLAEHAERADKRALREVEKIAADAASQQFGRRLEHVTDEIRAPWPPIANRVAGALAVPLRDVDHARLPQLYLNAAAALRQCVRIDECANFASKAEAIASYARQAKDGELRAMADRIKARALRRCGELLMEIKAERGRRTDLQLQDGTDPKLPTRAQVAQAAGLSERQRKTSLRVAAVPKIAFETAVESPKPATVTELARIGTRSRHIPTHTEILVSVPVAYHRSLAGTTVEELRIEQELAVLMAAWRDASREARVRFTKNLNLNGPSRDGALSDNSP